MYTGSGDWVRALGLVRARALGMVRAPGQVWAPERGPRPRGWIRRLVQAPGLVSAASPSPGGLMGRGAATWSKECRREATRRAMGGLGALGVVVEGEGVRRCWRYRCISVA